MARVVTPRFRSHQPLAWRSSYGSSDSCGSRTRANSRWCVGPLLLCCLFVAAAQTAGAQLGSDSSPRPNIVYFLVDNLGMGELSVYSGGPYRGTWTRRIDHFASQGLRLTNFAPESQCTPSRSALMTGRYSIRSGNSKGPNPAPHAKSGLVAWERTIAEVLSDGGYKTMIVGKWHIGESKGRWPTDHGFDEWYGISASYGESTWPSDPYYQGKVERMPGTCGPASSNAPVAAVEGEKDLQLCPAGWVVQQAKDSRDPVAFVTHSVKGQEEATFCCQLTEDIRRDIDRTYLDESKRFIHESKEAGKPFFLYFNHSMMHMPNIPRLRFKGETGHGDWADSLLELDTDFGELLDFLAAEGLEDDTIVVFSGDNGPEDYLLWRGHAGHWDGSYFTGMEGSLRSPALIRYPGQVEAGRVSNEIVHITDMFTTLIRWAGLEVPEGRVIDGVDQRGFFEGSRECSNREGFPYWLGKTRHGVKWRNFKLVEVLQRTLSEPALNLPTPNIVNLDRDPDERLPFDTPYLHTWVTRHAAKIITHFEASVACEPLVPEWPRNRLDYVPQHRTEGCWRVFHPTSRPEREDDDPDCAEQNSNPEKGGNAR